MCSIRCSDVIELAQDHAAILEVYWKWTASECTAVPRNLTAKFIRLVYDPRATVFKYAQVLFTTVHCRDIVYLQHGGGCDCRQNNNLMIDNLIAMASRKLVVCSGAYLICIICVYIFCAGDFRVLRRSAMTVRQHVSSTVNAQCSTSGIARCYNL